MIKNENENYYYNIFILITCDKKTKFQYYLWLKFLNNNILLHNDHNDDDDDIRMIGKIII
jgi:hypothetical protein